MVKIPSTSFGEKNGIPPFQYPSIAVFGVPPLPTLMMDPNDTKSLPLSFRML